MEAAIPNPLICDRFGKLFMIVNYNHKRKEKLNWWAKLFYVQNWASLLFLT